MDRNFEENPDYLRIRHSIEYLVKNRPSRPSLAEVSKAVGLSEYHFQRMFKRWAGVSPKDLLQFLTLEKAKERLSADRDILETSFGLGLSGPGRLHDLFVKIEGMSPGEYKLMGKGLTIEYGSIETPFGLALLGVTKRGVCHLHFVTGSVEQALSDLKNRWPLSKFVENPLLTGKLGKDIFQKRKSMSIFTVGNPFQIKVWEALLRIPEGTVVSYKDLARKIGKPGSARAVGSAVAENQIAWLIPCHRVIKANGLPGEYHWGAERKRAILCYETAQNG